MLTPIENGPDFKQLLEITTTWCKKHLEFDGLVDQETLFKSLKSEWENRLTLWEEINPFVKEKLDIANFYPDEIAIKETVGGLCKKLVHKTAQPAKTESEKDSSKNNFVPLPSGKRIDRPTVFILSSPRSGSTLLRTMLAGHTELNAPPELHLLGYSSLRSRERSIIDNGSIWKLSGLIQTIANQMQMTEGQAFALLSKLTDKDLPIYRIYEYIHSSSSKSILIDKSPSVAKSQARLNQAEQMFKDPKYIHLIRHPGAVIESLERMKHIILPNQLKDNDLPSRLKKFESIWRNNNGNTQKFLSDIPSKRHHRVRYEDLVRNPKSVMLSIAHFLGVEYEDSMLDPYSGERLISGIGDPNITSRSKVDSRLAESWKAKMGDYSFDEETIELANQLGIEA